MPRHRFESYYSHRRRLGLRHREVPTWTNLLWRLALSLAAALIMVALTGIFLLKYR